MKIKRLEIQGFKSFKDKTVIHFDHSITGIVGPNGCGKSNVVDAFFWVMGEQSYKHMRGSGSEDLIFNGSSKYSPLGFAEATLVMEMDTGGVDTSKEPSGASATDAPVHFKTKEISVTRRVYRGGEGEYFINGVQARLKDIHELFMDTGVGSKGYSIIEQGQIGKIVQSKPEDRRLLIEEAAGIAKYKARKKESLRKLEAAQANLGRLTDVIQEIERSLSSLERQAQKAQQYKKLKDELLEKEMTWGRRKNQVLTRRLKEMREKRDTLEAECVGLRAELQSAENTIEVDRVQELTLSKVIEGLNHGIQELAQELTRAQSALELSKRRQNDLATQLEMLTSEREELVTSISTEKERLSGAESESANAAEILADKSSKVRDQENATRAAKQAFETLRRELDSSKQSLVKGIQESSHLSNRAAALESKIESAALQIERVSSSLTDATEKQSIAETTLAETKIAYETATEAHASSSNELKERNAAQQDLERAVSAKRSEVQDLERTATKIRSKLQSLEELDAAFEGFGDGPKALLDWAKTSGKDSSLRAFTEGLFVEPGFEAALEGFLEGKLENLVSDEPHLALEALRELSQGKSGRASVFVGGFKPVDSSDVSALVSAAGITVIGPLSQFVKIDANLPEAGRNASAYLLSQAIVVESLDPLPELLKQADAAKLGAFSLVTKSGEAFDSVGILRGGSVQSDSSASVLGRKRAIEELRVQYAEAEIALNTAKEQNDELKARFDVAVTDLEQLRADVQDRSITKAKLERDFEQSKRAMIEASSKLEDLKEEFALYEEERASAISDQETIRMQISEAISTRSDLEEVIAAAEARFEETELKLREEEALLGEVRVEEASFRERANSIARELEAGLHLIRDRERRLADVERQLDRAESENSEHSGGDSGYAEKIEYLTIDLAQRRENLAEHKNDYEIVSANIRQAMSQVKSLHQSTDQKNHEVNSLALDIERVSSELSFLVQNLEEKYGVGCLEIPVIAPIQEEMNDPVVTLEMNAIDEQALSEEVEKLRERIRRLGEVNVMAIEEFEEKKKRYDHLTGEKLDLVKSMEDLNEAIEHINKTSEERFQKAFEAIRDRFERLFPIIFGGGQAKLSLVYPEGSSDILEAGVDILAQPPGKKVVNIGLLSGGEKALTAVSLIFAIFMVKPSPFCILDEVDAPLDDANIGKFNALLREMSAKSQFIIITHNKKTMELNDTLYGVTMEEPGVSKMVSIEMRA